MLSRSAREQSQSDPSLKTGEPDTKHAPTARRPTPEQQLATIIVDDAICEPANSDAPTVKTKLPRKASLAPECTEPTLRLVRPSYKSHRPRRKWQTLLIGFACAGVASGLAAAVYFRVEFINHRASPAAQARPGVVLASTQTTAKSETQLARVDERATEQVSSRKGLPKLDGSESTAPRCAELFETQKQTRARTVNDELQLARQAMIRGNWDASQVAFCRVLAADATNLHAMLGLSQVLLLRRDSVASATWAERALELEPSNRRAHGMLGDALVRHGKSEQAKQAWTSANQYPGRAAPSDDVIVEQCLVEADTATKNQDYARAERLFRRAAALRPNNAAASAGVAIALLRLGFPKAAELWATHAISLTDDNVLAQIAMGDVRAELGEHSAAEQHFRRAQELDPNNREVSRRLRSIHQLGG